MTVLSSSDEGTLLAVRVVPGAKKSQLVGQAAGRLKVRVQAPPVEGKANKELLRLLGRELGLRKNRLSLAGGERSRDKLVLLAGVPLAEAAAKLKSAGIEE